MRRYTNPTISATITPTELLTDVTDLYMMLKQDSTGAELIVGTSDGLQVDTSTGTVSYTLSRDESYSFAEGYVLIQVKGKTNGKYWASDIGEAPMKRILSIEEE